jgi:hypothetical protein
MYFYEQIIYGAPIDQIIGTELKLESRIEDDRLMV